MGTPRYPSLYQINTRVWLTTLAESLGRPATLDDIPDAELDRLAGMGFDWIWFLSVWQTGAAGQRVSRTNPEWRHEFQDTLPDLCDDDIAGSGFAITGYDVHEQLGGDAALARLRERLRARGLRLLLDFVPNHTGMDHPWVQSHPEFYVQGTDDDLAHSSQNYTRIDGAHGSRVFAYGRDPYFAGWPDTLQLNYANPATKEAMIATLLKIARQCDGVRCDMAMLVLPDVFERTWSLHAEPFWPRATARVREQSPDFVFMAEVYWDLEWTLQQQGFDYTYDKRLYDRLRDGHVPPIRAHFFADPGYQDRMARFLENHDEPRAATALAPGAHEAAAVITYLSPGLRFFHAGQFEGRTKRISPHLVRGPVEPVDRGLQEFYERLLTVLKLPAVRDGDWQLLECRPAWDGNWTSDCFVAYAWQRSDARVVVVVNYASNQSQCYVALPFGDLAGAEWRLADQIDGAVYDRHGGDLQSRGLFVDAAPWQASVFVVTRKAS
jgi:hypothetical protein